MIGNKKCGDAVAAAESQHPYMSTLLHRWHKNEPICTISICKVNVSASISVYNFPSNLIDMQHDQI